MDEHISWKSHIMYVSNKFAKVVGIIKKVYHILNQDTMRCLYMALAYPHLIYGVNVWSGTYSCHKHRLIVLQTKLVRIIMRQPYHYHTHELFKQLNILPFIKIIM